MPAGTPMMRQYHEIKARNQDCILFFRLGDFYEMFEDDARLVSKELDLTLTTRDRSTENPDERVPMCGVPYHSSEAYISRLIAKGYKVAICEQMEDPATAKGLVDRDIIRIVTPGTVMDASVLDEGKPNYLASVCLAGQEGAVCFADVTTGEICATSFKDNAPAHIVNELGRFMPSEIVMNAGAGENEDISEFVSLKLSCLAQTEDGRFDYMQSAMRCCEQFSVSSLDDLGIAEIHSAVCAVGALISYITETQKTDLSHINTLNFYTAGGQYMELDYQTVRNLELTQTLRTQEKRGSLLWVLDKTKTPMGSRMIRSWISRPLLSPAIINRRLAAVNDLVNDTVARSELIIALRDVSDFERLISKVVYGSANCRDLVSISNSITPLPRVAELLKGKQSRLLKELSKMDLLGDIKELIDSAVCDEPPFSVREGGIIREGYSQEVDHLRDLLNNSTYMLAQIEAKEKERTGKKLRVGYNKVFGYYIEIPRSMSEDVPLDYVRKQTLANCERFITQELKTLEDELLTAKDRLEALEYRLFVEVRDKIASQVHRVQDTASAVAQADALCSLAFVAVKNGYCMPEVDDGGVIEIKDGRHPVVEAVQESSLFVPNDVVLDSGGCRTAIITGPNMAGKSTYMRQTALMVLMAQMGSFVPAKYAHIGVVDRVFTRIGASDDLSAGKSTFMVEMTEVADILKNATKKSLILLDEIGRGTSTYDGMSIARAVLEYCSDEKKLGAKTLFATHYHELTELENELSSVKNFNISVKKRGDDIIFLRKIVPGGADDSYGIEVAGLAGVPETVIKRAKAVLASMVTGAGDSAPRKNPEKPPESQFSLEDMGLAQIAETLRNTDINTITPIEAMNMLFEFKKKV